MRQHRDRGCSRSLGDAAHLVCLTSAPGRRPRRSLTLTRIGALVLGSACSLIVACGGRSAAVPDASALPLLPGRQLLTLAGFSLSLIPAFPPCTPTGQPRDGLSVTTVVMLAKEGDEWVARSAPATGSVELRLRGTGISASGYGVAGTMTGTALDIGLMGVVRDVSITLGSPSGGGSATLDGETVSPISSLVVGRATGALRFSDSQGLSSTCPAIQWSMQPY